MADYFEMFEDCTIQEIYIEFLFEEWPLLATLEEEARQRLYTAISTALEAAACPVQAIKAKPDGLHLVAKVDVNLSLDDVADIVEVTARTVTTDSKDAQGPLSYSAESLSPSDVIDAVLRLR